MSYSVSDIAALDRVVLAVLSQPDEIHLPQLDGLRKIVSYFGGSIPAPVPKKAAPPVEEQDEPEAADEGRWAADVIDNRYNVSTEANPSEADEEQAMEIKAAAQELAGDGNVEEALVKLTDALRLTPNKAMYWALRSDYFLKLKKPNAAIADATIALTINSENARALRVRGTAYRHLGKWEESAHDLNEAQVVDYDDSVQELLKVVQPQANKKRDSRRHRELEEQERKERERRERERAARDEASAADDGFSGGMPGGFPGGMPGGFPGGMPGGFPGAGGIPPGMETLLSDPEIMAAMQDPEVAPKLMSLMSNPAAALQMMGDPKMGPLIQKIMSKMMGGGMGGMPGMGGMGGMPGMGGARPPFQGGAQSKRNASDDLD